MKQRTVLYADEGKILTNGTDYGREIFLAEDCDSSNYYEITEAEYNDIMLTIEEAGEM